MFRSFICTLILALSFSSLSAQSPVSISVSGGTSYFAYRETPGFSLMASVHYKTSEDLSLYTYTGVSLWSHDVAMFERMNYLITQGPHTLFPLFAGVRFSAGKVKKLNSYIEAEAGLSFVSYREFNLLLVEDKSSGNTYLISAQEGRNVRETRYGCGLGAGIIYPLNEIASVSLSYKLNVSVNPKYSSLVSNSVLAGINLNI